MADRFTRLITFVVDICTPVLKELLVKCAKADTKIIYTTFEAYMLSRKYDIRTLRTVRKDQLDRMYPSAGHFVEGALDVSLLATLLLNLFSTNLLIADEHAIKDIRDVRNTFLHKSNTDNITENEFDSKWSVLKTSVLHLTYSSGGVTYRDQINTEIQDLMLNNLPNLETSLKTWFFSLTFDFKEVNKHLTAVKRKLHSTRSEFLAVKKKLTRSTSELLAVKRKLTLTTARLLAVQKELKLIKTSTAEIKSNMESIGHNSKMSKVASLTAGIADRVARRIKENFDTTLRRYGNTSNEVPNIQEIGALLTTKHRIVIMGADIGSILRVAVQVIKATGCETQHGVEITNKDEWNSVEPAETSLMICKHPFGHLSFDEQKARCMLEIFDSILESEIDVIVLSQRAIMDEAIQLITHGEGHGLLNIRVDVDKACSVISEKKGADSNIQEPSTTEDGEFQARLVATHEYMRTTRSRYAIPFARTFVETAMEMLRQNKCIILTGRRHRENTCVALKLASLYHPDRFLLLKESKDIGLVSNKRTSLVLVEDFAGKNQYNETGMLKWIEAFETLYRRAPEERVDVIVTCTREYLNVCNDENVLQNMHVVDVPELTVVIHPENRGEQRVGQLSDLPTRSDMIHPLEVCVSSDGKKLAVSSSNDGKRCLQMYNIVT